VIYVIFVDMVKRLGSSGDIIYFAVSRKLDMSNNCLYHRYSNVLKFGKP